MMRTPATQTMMHYSRTKQKTDTEDLDVGQLKKLHTYRHLKWNCIFEFYLFLNIFSFDFF